MIKDYPMVLIEWIDSSGTGRWQSIQQVNEIGISICITVGFLISQDDSVIRIGQSIDQSENPPNFNNIIIIPKIAFTEPMTYLRRK